MVRIWMDLSILILYMVCCPSVWRYIGVVYFFGGDEGDSVVTIGGLVSKSMSKGRMGRALSTVPKDVVDSHSCYSVDVYRLFSLQWSLCPF